MNFSICVPNFNYGQYIGETIRSALVQSVGELEVLVSDNASTDDSVAVVRSIIEQDNRVSLTINRWNVGFAGNLDRAAKPASGRFMIMLSSDDLMLPNALSTYEAIYKALGAAADATIVASTIETIDSQGKPTGIQEIDWKQWRDAQLDPVMSEAAGANVYRVPAQGLLRRAMELMRSPLPFLSTCYPRALYEAVEGYGGQRAMNPDKWFNWKLLSVAETALIVDKPLFAYRKHDAQVALVSPIGALKHLGDQFSMTWDTPQSMLERAGFERGDLARAFVRHDIGLRGLANLARGDTQLARRVLRYGLATFPKEASADRSVWLLRVMLALGPVGVLAAKAAEGRVRARWAKQESSTTS